MALREETRYFIGILNDGQIEVRRTRAVFDVDDLVGERHHRQVLEPGQDVTAYPPKIRQICAVVWTPQVITDWLAWKAANGV